MPLPLGESVNKYKNLWLLPLTRLKVKILFMFEL
jgi:hypothetical protein